MEETMKQEEVRIPFDRLCLAVVKALHTLGVPAEIAELEAAIMAEIAFQAVPSHGVRMLPARPWTGLSRLPGGSVSVSV
jgi:LDH2 family malate/lactate/ureidoglycolate dehydrogenase